MADAEMNTEDEAVMPKQQQDQLQAEGGGAEGPAVVVPQDAARYKDSREALGELPTAPATVTLEDGDAVMADAEQDQEDAGDDLFGDDDDENDDDDAAAAAAAPAAAAGMADLPPMPEPAPAAATSNQEIPLQDLPPVPSTTAAHDVHHDVHHDNEAGDLSDAELERRRRLEYEEEDEQAPAVEEKQVQYADVKLPKLPMATEKQKLWHAKLPNFLHLEQRAFHAPSWDPKVERENTNVPVENTIRWRWSPSASSSKAESAAQPAQRKKQTNARIIRWSDGSLSLQLGSEIFDIATDRTVTSHKSVIPPNASLNALPATASTSTSTSSSRNSESTTYLVAQHPYAGLLESQAKVTGNLTFRPTNIQSSSHRKMATALSGKHVKTSKTVMMMASNDPELVAKAKAEQEAKAKKAKRAAAGAGDGSSSNNTKKKTGRKSVRSSRIDDFSDNEPDEEEDGDDATLKQAERKRQRAREQAEMDDFLASESDEDEDEDDDGEEGGGGTSSSRKKKTGGSSSRRDEEMDIEDDLDAMEAQAEKARRAAKKNKKSTAGSEGSQQQPPPIMRQQQARDIDSDDLDADDPPEETIVKKKLVIESDDED